MNKEYDAIVVGGGMAGLTGAAYLCKYGYKTLLCEKSHKTGGLVNTFRYRDFAFDAGIRAFENSGILLPMLKNLGLEMEFTSNPVTIGIRDKWIKFRSRENITDYGNMLSGIFPENSSDIEKITQEIQKVICYMDVLYGIDNPIFEENMKDKKYLLNTLLPWLMRYKVNISKAGRLNQPVSDYLTRFTSNRALIDMIVQHFFDNTPTFFALSYFGLYLDYRYPKGGTEALAKAVTDFIVQNGGKILTDTAVTKVDADKKALFTADGEQFCYKKLIWACDQKTLYASVSSSQDKKTSIRRELAKKGKGGNSILTLFIGADFEREYFENRCGAHAFYTPSAQGLSSLNKWDETAEDNLFEWLGQFFERTTYEISIPALRDTSLAPKGKTGIIVSTLMDYHLVRQIFEKGYYEKFKEYCISKITDVLEASVFPGLKEKTEFALCSTPLTIEKETGNTHGAITGWAFTNEKLPAENRFKKILNSIKTPIDNVYQCGQWTFCPSGLPVSILTGKVAADAVHKDLKGKFL